MIAAAEERGFLPYRRKLPLALTASGTPASHAFILHSTKLSTICIRFSSLVVIDHIPRYRGAGEIMAPIFPENDVFCIQDILIYIYILNPKTDINLACLPTFKVNMRFL